MIHILAEREGIELKACKPSIHAGFQGAASAYVSSFVSTDTHAVGALWQ